MTPGARIQAAIEILEAIERGSLPADIALARWSRASRYAGSGDRRAVGDLVYAVIRRRGQLAWWLERTGGEPSPRSLLVAALALIEGRSATEIAGAFDGRRYSPATLSQEESAVAAALDGRSLDDPEQPTHARLNCPDWLAPLLRRSFDADWEAEVEALNGEATVDLRVNTLKASREEARRLLAAEGVNATPTPFSPVGLRIETRQPLNATRAWRDGLIEPQDEASQIVALLVGARLCMRVLDLCAGGGGKTLAMAAAMGDRGRIVACDVAAGRLRQARPRVGRAGVTIVEERILTAEGDEHPALGSEDWFDRVLIDAPCSGTGSWRRRPDERWRLAPQRLEDLRRTQEALLDRGARLVRIGGRLIYATCSLLRCENEEAVEAFLARRPDFWRIALAQVWRETIGGDPPGPGPDLLLTPHRHGTDGFFAAVMERLP